MNIDVYQMLSPMNSLIIRLIETQLEQVDILQTNMKGPPTVTFLIT